MATKTQGPALAGTSPKGDPLEPGRSSRARLVAVDGPLVLGACIVVGIAFRVWLLILPTGASDSDESVVGLIARHALYHHEFHAFFWGQAYGGTLEALLATPLFWLFGASVAALKAVPLTLSAVAALLVWRLGRRTVGEPAAKIAAAAFWLAPANYLWLSTKERGFYWVALVGGLALLVFACRLAENPTSVPDWLAFGFFGGLGIWTSPQVLYVIAPAVLWVLFHVGRHWWRGVFAIPTGLLAGLPWLAFNLNNGFASFDRPPFVYDRGYVGNFKLLLTQGIPVALGLHAGEHWLNPAPLMRVAYVVVLAAIAIGVARRPAGTGLLLMNLAAYLLLWGIYPVSGVIGEGRYVMLLLPTLALLLTHAAVQIGGRPLLAAVLVASMALTGLGIHRIRNITAPPSPDVAMPRNLGPAIDFLERNRIDRVYANYWVAYRLDFESHERVIATPADATARYQPYVDKVAAAPAPAYVFPAASRQVLLFLAGLDRLGMAHHEDKAGEFVIVQPAARADWFKVMAAGG